MDHRKRESVTQAGRILVFAKAPVAGQVKTRLVPPLSLAGAAALHRELVERTLRAATTCPCIQAVELWCAPDASDPFFQQCSATFSVSLRTQQGNDLGSRMHHALATAIETGSPFALLIGTDCPALTPTYLCSAATALTSGADVVLAPAEDGGYVLIGLRNPQPQIFNDIPWGQDTVLQATREHIGRLGLIGYELPMVWDLDRPHDLVRYQQFSDNCRG